MPLPGINQALILQRYRHSRGVRVHKRRPLRIAAVSVVVGAYRSRRTRIAVSAPILCSPQPLKISAPKNLERSSYSSRLMRLVLARSIPCGRSFGAPVVVAESVVAVGLLGFALPAEAQSDHCRCAEFVRLGILATSSSPSSDPLHLVLGVPELSTWAMMFLGFAGLGYAAFRRSSRSSISALA
jgi:hypothetical protein